MKRAADIVKESMDRVEGYMPWDLKDLMDAGKIDLIVDVREPYEFEVVHMPGSICIPRGIIEGAAEWGTRNTVPVLAGAREKNVVLVCLGGERSAMAADILMVMGFQSVRNLKTGLRGWNDSEYPLINPQGPVDPDDADAVFNKPATPEQMGPLAAGSSH